MESIDRVCLIDTFHFRDNSTVTMWSTFSNTRLALHTCPLHGTHHAHENSASAFFLTDIVAQDNKTKQACLLIVMQLHVCISNAHIKFKWVLRNGGNKLMITISAVTDHTNGIFMQLESAHQHQEHINQLIYSGVKYNAQFSL